MTTKPTGESKPNPRDLDLRVRERNLRAGVLDPAALAAHLGALPDLDANADTVRIQQPALAQDPDLDDDDDDDSDD